MLYHKKGMEKETIVALVLLLVSFVVLVGYALYVKISLDKSGDIEGCKLSVLSRSIKGLRETNLPVDCPIVKINILSKNDRKVKNEENIFVDNQEQIKEAIAKEMYDCWNKFGKGELDFVSDFELFEDRACYVCSQINFGSIDRLVPEDGFIKNYEAYLIETDAPLRNISYYKYFQGKLPLENERADLSVQVKKNKPIAVTYFVTKEGVIGRLRLTLSLINVFTTGGEPLSKAAGFALVGTDVIAGERDFKATLVVSPYEDLISEYNCAIQ